MGSLRPRILWAPTMGNGRHEHGAVDRDGLGGEGSVGAKDRDECRYFLQCVKQVGVFLSRAMQRTTFSFPKS